MSQHTLKRIANVLDKQFGGQIDMSDWHKAPEADVRLCFLSRAFAALCIKRLAGTDAQTAAASVTDGFRDNGIDALHFSPQLIGQYCISYSITLMSYPCATMKRTRAN
jgi:hypothetical protein